MGIESVNEINPFNTCPDEVWRVIRPDEGKVGFGRGVERFDQATRPIRDPKTVFYNPVH